MQFICQYSNYIEKSFTFYFIWHDSYLKQVIDLKQVLQNITNVCGKFSWFKHFLFTDWSFFSNYLTFPLSNFSDMIIPGKIFVLFAIEIHTLFLIDFSVKGFYKEFYDQFFSLHIHGKPLDLHNIEKLLNCIRYARSGRASHLIQPTACLLFQRFLLLGPPVSFLKF